MLKPIDLKEVDIIAVLFAKAFYTDPLFKYFFSDDRNRILLSTYTFKFIIRHALLKGDVFKLSDNCEGAAIWLPSNKIKRSLWDQIRHGVLKMLFFQSFQSIKRQVNASEYMQAIHKALIKSDHIYLSTIGVDPVHHCSGYGSKMLEALIKKLDEENLLCYLDTHNKNNVPFYKKFGFYVAHESLIPDTDVYHWAMIRTVVNELE